MLCSLTASRGQGACEIKLRREFIRVIEDESRVWSPAPVVYGKVINNLSLSQSQFIPRMQLQRWHERGFELPISGDAESPVRSPHHLLEGWDCVAMMTCDGPPLSPRWLPIPASTDMATASAAAREVKPLGPVADEGLGAKELCCMTGAGEPVGSDVSLICTSPERHKELKVSESKAS